MAVLLHRRPEGLEEASPVQAVGTVGIIGAGRVGTALAAALHARGATVVAVAGRTTDSSERMARDAALPHEIATNRAGVLASASLVFLTVPDAAIAPLCEEIAREEGWRAGQAAVHCSGALPSSILDPAREQGALAASFHPLQTFANLEAAIHDLPGSTFGMEGDHDLLDRLARLVDLLDGTSLVLTPEEKVLYHAAAVIACNYTVTLVSVASHLMVRAGIAPDDNTALRYLMPLMRGTIDNLEILGLPGALTGPLPRGDTLTVAHHLEALQASAPDLLPMYRALAHLALPVAQAKTHLSEETMAEFKKLLESSS